MAGRGRWCPQLCWGRESWLLGGEGVQEGQHCCPPALGRDTGMESFWISPVATEMGPGLGCHFSPVPRKESDHGEELLAHLGVPSPSQPDPVGKGEVRQSGLPSTVAWGRVRTQLAPKGRGADRTESEAPAGLGLGEQGPQAALPGWARAGAALSSRRSASLSLTAGSSSPPSASWLHTGHECGLA